MTTTTRRSLFCLECKQPCGETTRDLGIGSYEWWGSKEYHRDVRTVSQCCETEMTDTDPLPDVCCFCGLRMPEGTAHPVDDERLACDACAIVHDLETVGA